MAEKAVEKTSDKPEEARTTPAQRNTEQIMTHLSEYISIRFDQAARINPGLKHMKQDLMYHEMSNVRRTLLSEKIYGPIRLVVADVFLSDDDKKRRNLMSPSDQTSIQVELVSHCQDEKVETTRGQIKFHDLKSFYAAIDPALTSFIDLIETWIWWDILDAVELVRFEQKLGKVSIARQGRVGEDMRRRYSFLIQPLTDTEQQVALAGDEDILKYELGQLQQLRDQWRFRHHGELAYKFVLRRDEEAIPNQGEMIQPIAEKVREYDAVSSLSEITEDMQKAYAPELKLQPARVTKNLILQHLQNQMVALERDMVRQTDDEQRLGPPYNFKDRQIEKMERWLYDLKTQLASILTKEPASAVAGTTQGQNKVELKPESKTAATTGATSVPATASPKSTPAPAVAVANEGLDQIPGAMSIAGTPGLNPESDYPIVDPKLGF